MTAAIPEDEAGNEAVGEALAHLLAGRTEAGLTLYGQCLADGGAQRLPIGGHLLFLEQAGRMEAAGALRALAARRGGDVATKKAADEIVAEYESLFARGIANSRMVSRYLIALTRLGRGDRVAAMLAPEWLLRIVRLELPAPDGEPGGLAAAVQHLLLRREREAVHEEEVQSVRNMRKLDHLERLDDPAARALIAALREQTELYLRDWAAADHPLSRLVPARFPLKAWGLISRGEGFNTRHIHHKGWATGIYYPAGVAGDGPGGALRIGPPGELGEEASGWIDVEVRPEAGLLVLMPSFYVHWTVPLGRPGLRTSIAFDLLTDPD